MSMNPPCTATCSTRDMLAVAVTALANGPCPFQSGAGLDDETHVDFHDPECYDLLAVRPRWRSPRQQDVEVGLRPRDVAMDALARVSASAGRDTDHDESEASHEG